jgi:dolichol-phosphate mannosyltransferase
VRGGGAADWNWTRRLNSYGVNLLTRLTLGLRVHDASTGYRCFRRDALEAVDPRRLIGSGYAIMEELSYRAERAGHRPAEHPITFVGRRRGLSKTSLKQGIGVMAMLMRLRFGPMR